MRRETSERLCWSVVSGSVDKITRHRAHRQDNKKDGGSPQEETVFFIVLSSTWSRRDCSSVPVPSVPLRWLGEEEEGDARGSVPGGRRPGGTHLKIIRCFRPSRLSMVLLKLPVL